MLLMLATPAACCQCQQQGAPGPLLNAIARMRLGSGCQSPALRTDSRQRSMSASGPAIWRIGVPLRVSAGRRIGPRVVQRLEAGGADLDRLPAWALARCEHRLVRDRQAAMRRSRVGRDGGRQRAAGGRRSEAKAERRAQPDAGDKRRRPPASPGEQALRMRVRRARPPSMEHGNRRERAAQALRADFLAAFAPFATAVFGVAASSVSMLRSMWCSKADLNGRSRKPSFTFRSM